MTCPCGICEERYAGCHAECDAYKAWDADRWRQREAEIRQRRRADLLDDFKAESIAKGRRRHR